MPFHTGCTFRHGIVGDEQIRIHGQLGKAFAFALGVSAKDDTLSADLDAPCQSGNLAVNDAHRVESYIAVAQNESGRRSGYNIMRLQLVCPLGAGCKPDH